MKAIPLIVILISINCHANAYFDGLSALGSTCRALLSRSNQKSIQIPNHDQLKTFFKELEDFGVNHERMIEKIGRYYEKHSVADGVEPVWLSDILLKRRGQGDSTLNQLLELGFTLQNGILRPPRDLATLYTTIYQKISQSAKAAKVSDADLILPTVIFSRFSSGNMREEFMYVRPGIDPLPPKSQGWGLKMEDTEVEDWTFAQLIADGKMILSPIMFFHDINHILDLIERPKTMPALKKFMRAKLNYLARGYNHGGSDKALIKKYGHNAIAIEGDLVLNEFLSYPREAFRSEIHGTLISSSFDSPSDVVNRYEGLGIAGATEKANEFLEKRELFFVRHGGGIREIYIERTSTDSTIATGIVRMMDNKQPFLSYSRDKRTIFEAYLHNEPSRMFRRLEMIQRLLKSPKGYQDDLRVEILARANRSGMSEANFLLHLLAKQLADIDQRLRAGLYFQITPEKIFTDLSLLGYPQGWRKYLKTATHAYFSTYPRGSYQRVHFANVHPAYDRYSDEER